MMTSRTNPLFTVIIIYYAIVSGVIVITVIALLFPLNINLMTGAIYNYGITLMVLIIYRLGVFFSKRITRGLEKPDKIKSRIGKYQKSVIIRLASIYGGAILCIISYMISRDYFFLGVLIFSFALLIQNKPSPEQASELLNLSWEEILDLKK